MRRKPHVRFGGRAEETDQPKRRHRASVRSNHTGNTLAAATGASTRELMARMGHSSARAALLYQHATVERERQIADKLNDMITAARTTAGAAADDPAPIVAWQAERLN